MNSSCCVLRPFDFAQSVVALFEGVEDIGWGCGTVREAQFVNFCVGEGEGGGTEKPYKGEIVGGVGDGGERIKQVADFGAVVEAASRDGDERDVRRFERVFVNGESSG